jgi:hypothetical protein
VKLYVIETVTWVFFTVTSGPEEAMHRALQVAEDHAEFTPSVYAREAEVEDVEFYCAA